MEILWRAVCNVVRTAIVNYNVKYNIAAIGITGQMHGIILLDVDYKPLRPAIIWADRRSITQVTQLKGRGVEDKAGNPVSAGMFLSSLLWVKENEPDLFIRVSFLANSKTIKYFTIV